MYSTQFLIATPLCMDMSFLMLSSTPPKAVGTGRERASLLAAVNPSKELNCKQFHHPYKAQNVSSALMLFGSVQTKWWFYSQEKK